MKRSIMTVSILAATTGFAGAAIVPTSTPAQQAAPVAGSNTEFTAAESSNAFGIELYRALARAKPDSNLFISPYSMSIALTMAAEGARDETEAEMARVLHLPAAKPGARAVTPVHEGYHALARRFAAGAGNADETTRKRIDSLREQLAAANAESEKQSRAKGWDKARESQSKAEKLAAELNTLFSEVDRFDLRVANALWVEQTYPLAPEYVKTIDRFYGSGGVAPLDFINNPEASRARINQWVEEHTANRIKDLLPSGSLTPDSRLVITNAVYFMGQWARPFEPGSTREEDFTPARGKPVKARMMNDAWRSAPYAAFNGDGSFFATPREVPKDEAKRPATYPDAAGMTMIEMPYKGGDLSMVLILPRAADGLEALEAKLGPAALSGWLSRLEPRTVDTALPRFKVESEQEMSQTLKALGMKRAFVDTQYPDSAQFGGMSASEDPTHRLFIGAVQHKAWVEVTEKGTEAAAATAVLMPAPGMAMRPPEEMIPFTPRLHADHPFLFVIRDIKSGAILFIGRVTAPAVH